MKKLPLKKLAIGTVAAGIIAFGIFYFTNSKGKKTAPNFIDPAFSEYITSYTAGVVPSNSTIKIMLSKEAVDSTLIGQESSVSLFDFSPDIKGKTIWVDKRMVEFRPEGRLTSGQIYEVTFKLSKIMEVPSNLKSFEYSFQVMPQNFEVNIDNIKPYVKTELTRQKVEGTLLTADYAETNAVEKLMEASQEGKNLKISWQHDGEGKHHSFIIEDVARKAEASAVKLKADGKSLGLDNHVEKEIEVPSLSDFKLMNAKVVQNPTQYVALQFSDPLKEKQELEGLITIGEKDLSLDFDIHDNEIWVYPAVRQAGTQTIKIEAGVRNINDYKMKDASIIDVVFEQLKPEVRFTGNGVILPSSDGLILPFEAVNLKSVDVTVKKVFENNILQFLQVNKLDGDNEWHRVGKRVLKKNIQLDNTGVTDLGKWNRYTLDLAQMINAEPGAIYEIKLSFKKTYSSYACEGEEASEDMTTIEEDNDDDYNEGYREYYYEEGEYYYDEDYDWEQRDNPCNSSYYASRRNVSKNILASDLGLLAKAGDGGQTTIVVNDIKTTQPLSGVTLEFYDYQQQLLGTLSTGADGTAVFESKETPFAVIAKSGAQRGYMRLVDGESLSLSGFDVSGEYVAKGLKGFIYGDRGVWRPGDSLYLNFILEDKNKKLPATHPVVFELQNPQGVVTSRLVKSAGENGFYKFATATTADAPTGNWMARVKVGGTEFNQTVKIETIKPNRLKINLDVGEKIIGPEIEGRLNVKWLHGAPGKNLKAQFEVSLVPQATTFPKYDDYIFDEATRPYNTATQSLFEGATDESGNAAFTTALDKINMPGFMTAVFRGKVFEESGNFSTDRFSVSYYPYNTYAGIRTAKGERYSGMLYTDTVQNVDIVFLDTNGKPVDRSNADVTLYKLNRYWWWDNSSSSIANYIEENSSALYSTGKVTTVNGKAKWTFKVPTADWGTFYLRMCDPVSGHCAGKMIYLDQRGYYGRYSRDTEEKGGATRLNFSADKSKYNVGEKINLTIPSSAQGRALISVENGTKVIKTLWKETTQGETKVSIDVTSDMTPNIFLSISLLQPHAQTLNDLPIRMYGIIPIGVEDPATHLQPVISMPEEIQPGQEVTIKVSEKTNRKMTFTVAMVDEGLLDITKFNTPKPWNRFYAREALGVKTWDVYDQVMGAFGGRIERLLAVGGDGEMEAKEEDPRANRFKPVVKFFGPITINAGDDKEIKFIMPQYIGSVKTMVVAGYEGAYGNAENVTPVRKPLMVLATLPRVLGPEETLKLPVTLFTQDKKIKNVKVDVKVSGPLSLTNGSSQNVSMSASGDLTVNFDLAVKSETGIGKVVVTASSGQYQASDEIEIDVRNPNPPVSEITEMFLEPGKSWSSVVKPVGVAGTNSATLEVSTIPPINLGYRLHYLIDYPHGCIEQTTSAAFPQLYLDVVKELNDPEKARIKLNIAAAIDRYKLFVAHDGGFGYWPGDYESNSWGSTYAGHFLIEAESKGYFVPSDLIKRWKKYQKGKALEWRRNTNRNDYWYRSTDLDQAYRLYTLAIAGAAEIGAMNRLRELSDLPVQAKWMLAAAYAKVGQVDAAKKIVANLTMEIQAYKELAYTYGSDLRDKAIILETLVLLNERAKGFELLKVISKSLSDKSYWMSTQTISFCLKAIGQFIAVEKRGDMAFTYSFNNKTFNASSALPVSEVPLTLKGVQQMPIQVKNSSKGSLFIRVITTGTPARGQETDGENGLIIVTKYTDAKGSIIDPTKLEQGTEFLAQVSVKNPGLRDEYRNMALTQIFPSGWEINNLRITDDESLKNEDHGEYQDIRDDRVYTYFYLNAGQTRTFKVMLTASYLGQFYLPAISCEAMYDNSIYSRKKGQPVEVSKEAENQ
jgi:uncharacterized protein YfaS (alpha-2-macroglobulin family)